MRIPTPAIAAALAGLLLAWTHSADACSCTGPRTVQDEFDASEIVFSGHVLSAEVDPFGNIMVMLEPIQRWKGPLGYTVYLITPLDEAVCGFPFEVGQDYLVYATTIPYGLTLTPQPFTHLCTRTALLDGNSDLAELPPPLLPTPATARSWGTLKLGYR